MKVNRNTPINEAMTHLPLTIDGKESVETAKKTLYENEFRHLPVVSDGILRGIITDRDLKLAYAAADNRELLSKRSVESICITEPYTAEKETPLLEVLQVLLNRDIGSVIITDNKFPIGIFTLTDVTQVLAGLLNQE